MLSANTVLVVLVLAALAMVLYGGPRLMRWGISTFFDIRERQERLAQERVRRQILEQELVNKTLEDEFTKPKPRRAARPAQATRFRS